MRKWLYDADKAVAYAEEWWNDYNPAFPHFEVDCTNFISQCLFAGGMLMHGAPARGQGWWYVNNNWSFSWSVAHSHYWYLTGLAQVGEISQVRTAPELYPGDIICYDFEGNNRWDHTTIVVAKNERGEPLVNAHTDNSWHRLWMYRDSMAWTPEIQYRFFHI